MHNELHCSNAAAPIWICVQAIVHNLFFSVPFCYGEFRQCFDVSVSHKIQTVTTVHMTFCDMTRWFPSVDEIYQIQVWEISIPMVVVMAAPTRGLH
jgi:hypothetical protein